MNTLAEIAALKAKYPEGIPAWMFEADRSYSAAHIDTLMQLRRRAFPATKGSKPVKSGRERTV